jgi:hypothetical protein
MGRPNYVCPCGNRYNEYIYEQVKAQSIQLSNLADMVESLQSEVKQLQETTRLGKHRLSRNHRISQQYWSVCGYCMLCI